MLLLAVEQRRLCDFHHVYHDNVLSVSICDQLVKQRLSLLVVDELFNLKDVPRDYNMCQIF